MKYFYSATVALLCCLALASSGVAQSSPLTDYVHTFDGFYSWNVSETILYGDEYVAYNLYVTSQKWLTYDETSSPIWTHWAQVIVPNNMLPDSDMAFLYIDGGSVKDFDNPPTDVYDIVSSVAVSTGTIGIDLMQIPNQPIYFTGDPDNGRSEDAMIAYTWSHFVNNTNEPDWLARCPMTKGAIKTMDAVQEFVKTLPGVPDVKRFGVAGASKRGWTTWMVGAMQDPRVVGIVPIVAPIGNIVPQINEMWQSYGNWSFALIDYIDMNLMGWLNLPRFQEMLDIIDPLAYPIAMEHVPKHVVVASMDEFFMPDSARYYWDDLKGYKSLEIVPNADHSLAGHAFSVLASVEQFYMAIYYNQTEILPQYDWDISPDGTTITLTTQTTENLVKARVLISYENPERDWRLVTCTDGISCINLAYFVPIDLEPVSPGVYEYTAPMPLTGYTAFYIEVQYEFGLNDLGSDKPLRITSNMSIIPTEMPYEPCPQDVCACGYDCAHNYYNGDDSG